MKVNYLEYLLDECPRRRLCGEKSALWVRCLVQDRLLIYARSLVIILDDSGTCPAFGLPLLKEGFLLVNGCPDKYPIPL